MSGIEDQTTAEERDVAEDEQAADDRAAVEFVKARIQRSSRFREFLEASPLYSSITLLGGRELPDVTGIEFECEKCGQSRPFLEPPATKGVTTRPGHAKGATDRPGYAYLTEFVEHVFVCGTAGCSTQVRFYIRLKRETDRVVVEKVGQSPRPPLSLPAVVMKTLGDDAEMFRKAQMCVNLSLGIGAMAYLRRTLEASVDNLLQMIRRDQIEEGVTDLSAIDAALEEKVFTTKTKLAIAAAPRSLIVDGTNPLKVLHDELSELLHAKSDDEALKAARRATTALVFVATKVKQEAQLREEFRNAMKKSRAAD